MSARLTCVWPMARASTSPRARPELRSQPTMALITPKPTSPGRRGVVRVAPPPGLHKGEPYAPLTEVQSKTGGRNHFGRITVRHRGGGHKQHYRIIDFKRDRKSTRLNSSHPSISYAVFC